MAHLEGNRRGSTTRAERPILSRLSFPNWAWVEQLLPAIIVAVALLAWEWGARSGRITTLFFPAPSTTAATLGRLLGDGELLTHLGSSLRRVLLGLLFGGVPGLLIGLLIGWSPRLHRVIDPLIAAAHPIPKIAILPLIMVIFGVDETPKVIIAATGAFFPIVINTTTGARQINRIYFEVARNYGASPIKVLTRVILPGSLPFMISGLLLALNITLLLTIAVEMVSGYSGLGSMIWFAWETMRVEEIYASLAVITLLGIGFNLTLRRLSRFLVPWQVERER